MSETKHTPGPWGWFGQGNGSIYLATVHGGRRYVMRFARKGMQFAQPVFQPGNRGLVNADELLQFEAGNPAIVGMNAAKADKTVYRYDIRGIDCADARLISAAPDMAEALRRIAAIENKEYGSDWEEIEEAREIAVSVLAKIEGDKP